MDYSAQASSPLVNGDVKLMIDQDGLTVSGLFDVIDLPFADVTKLSLDGYVVTLETDAGVFALSRLGNWCQPFYDALCDAYNQAVLRALFVGGVPVLAGRGDYRFGEAGAALSGVAPVQVYEDCVVTLPPSLDARRVPLCFVTGLQQGDFQVTLGLDDGETYTYAKLGYDTEPFVQAISAGIRALRDKSLAMATEVDPSLTPAQGSQIAQLLPAGVAAPMGRLMAAAPSFGAALEARIAAGPAAQSYPVLAQMTDAASVWVGIKPGDTTDDYLLWLIAPSSDKQFAVVEFAQDDAATFVYRTGGDFDGFAGRLNRALEAIAFHREAIWMTDDDLALAKNAAYRMAVRRTAALQFVRANYVGRAIHSGDQAWQAKLAQLMGGQAGS